jgi:hypothetical protein
LKRFGRDMCLHDFRRSAATYLAIDAPEHIGLIPALLQHASPEMGKRYYNLANGIKASQRLARNLALTKKRLRSLRAKANASEVGELVSDVKTPASVNGGSPESRSGNLRCRFEGGGGPNHTRPIGAAALSASNEDKIPG